ncbi:hypothetical protein FRY77_30490 [Halomonas sp. MG34]|nr:hypothetical protein [Halomonas sp. MG34]
MKKKIVPILSCVLVSLFLVVTPSQTQVSAQKSGETVQSTQTRTVTQTKPYRLNQSIPSSISYNVGGWSGTLYRVSSQSTGDYILVRYSGSVHCSGSCVLPSKLEEQK